VYDLNTDSSLYLLENGVAISNCNCRSIPVAPGETAEPFIDYEKTVAEMSPADQRHAMGASNWKLIEGGLARWSDVVTPGRIRDFREVVDRLDITVKDMRKVGISRAVAFEAHNATHTEAHHEGEALRRTLIEGLRTHGLSDRRIAAEVATLLGKRFGLVGPAGFEPGFPGPAPPIKPPPRPRPKPEPKPEPKPVPKPEPTPKPGPVAMPRALEERSKAVGLRVVPTSPNPVTPDQVESVLGELEKLPPRIHRIIAAVGGHMDILNGRGITDHPTYQVMKGQTPRGWPAGRTWDDVPGVAPTRPGEPTAIVVNRLRERHGALNLVIHEHIHSFDYAHEVALLGGRRLSDRPEWRRIHAAASWDREYHRKYPEEGFAYAFELYYHDEATRAAMDPAIRKYIESVI
jgi:hypothetical protein